MTTPAAVIMDTAAYAQAVEDAVKASAAYYRGWDVGLDDDAYDRLVRGIAAWEAEHPDQVPPDSPTGKVARRDGRRCPTHGGDAEYLFLKPITDLKGQDVGSSASVRVNQSVMATKCVAGRHVAHQGMALCS